MVDDEQHYRIIWRWGDTSSNGKRAAPASHARTFIKFAKQIEFEQIMS